MYLKNILIDKSINLGLSIYSTGPLTDKWDINGRVVSFPLTNMRYINGWVVSLILRLIAKDFLKGNKMKKTGFYIIKDEFLIR